MRTIVAALALTTCAALAQQEKTVTGVVGLYAAGRMMLVLDKDAGPGLPINTTLTFIVNEQTQVSDRGRASNALSIQGDQKASVTYVDTRQGLVARQVRLLGPYEPEPERSRPPAYEGTTPPQTKPSNGGGGGNLVVTTDLANLTEVRLQATDKQGAPALDRVKAGADFFIAFYVQVNGKAAFRLAYQCQRPDLDAGNTKVMARCNYEEDIPAGFRGTKYRVFPMRYERGADGMDLIIGEVAPVIRTTNSVTRAWQRKLVPVKILP